MEGYEKDYHLLRHNYLYSNSRYYNIRAKVALLKYFNDIPKDARILDFGCGLGHNIYLMSNSIGYDISKFCLDFCKKKGINIVDDLKEIKDKSFDAIFSCHVLEHVENPFGTIKLISKKLKIGGKLILIFPVGRYTKPKHFELTKSQHLYNWNFSSINNLLIKNGFKVMENKFLKGDGYKKLLFFSFNLKLYRFLTQLVGLLHRQKEMKIVAIKEKNL